MHQDLALPDREGLQRRDQGEVVEPDDHLLFGGGHVGCELGRDLVHDRAVPEHRAGTIDHRLPQAGQRVVAVPQPPPGGVHGDERVLDEFLRGRGVSDPECGQPDQGPVA